MSRLVRDEEIDATIEALRKAREARGQTPDRPPTEEERWEEFKKEPPAYLRGLSREQLEELNELAGTAVGAAEGFTPESAAELIPFVAGGKDFADTVAAEQLALKVQSGQATPEENFEFAKSQVEARRERTFMGGVGEMARSTVPIMGELGIAAATGAGATGLAGRIALNEAKRQSKREIAKAMLKVGLKEMGTGTGQVLSTVAAREAIPRLLGHGGGTWSGNALKRALPDLEFTPEELEELAVLADRDFADRLMGKMREESSVWAGALEDFVSVGVERGAGTMIGRLPGIAKAKAIQARVWQKLAGSGSKADFMTKIADDVAYAGALEETLEELFQGAVTEELFGDGVLEGLPSTFQELGQIAMVGALPAGIAAPFARAAEISSQRQREEAFKRANPEQAEGSPTGTSASGGDSVSSGEATAATAGVEPDVIPPPPEAVEAFASAAGLENAQAIEPETEDQAAAVQLARNFGREYHLIRGEGEPRARGMIDPEGRMFQHEGAASALEVGVHELGHAVADALGETEFRAELAKVEAIAPGIVDRYTAKWRRRFDESGLPEGRFKPAEVLQEGFSTLAEEYAALIAYGSTSQGAADLKAIAEASPSLFGKLVGAVKGFVGRLFRGRQAAETPEARVERITGQKLNRQGAELSSLLSDIFRRALGGSFDGQPAVAAQGAGGGGTLLEELQGQADTLGVPRVQIRRAEPLPEGSPGTGTQQVPLRSPTGTTESSAPETQPEGERGGPAGASTATAGEARGRLNNPLASPEQRAVLDEVDRARERAGLPEVQPKKEAVAAAKKALREDYAGTRFDIEKKLARGETLSTWETHAAADILEGLTLDVLAGVPGASQDAIVFGNAFREVRAETARRLSTLAGRGRPAADGTTEREFLIDMVTSPSPSGARKLKRIRDEIGEIMRAGGLTDAGMYLPTSHFATMEARSSAGRMAPAVLEPSEAVKRRLKKLKIPPNQLNSRGEPISEERVLYLEEQRQKILEREAKLNAKAAQALREQMGVDIESLAMDDLLDPNIGWKYKKVISSAKATPGEKMLEYRYMSILSGILTQFRNISGNSVNLAMEGPVQKLSEATVNAVVRDPDSASGQELMWWFKGFAMGLRPAFRNLVRSYSTEGPTFELDLQRRGVEMGAYGTKLDSLAHGPKMTNLPAKGLRHFSTNTLLAMDEFFKTISAFSEAYSLAFRRARKEGLKGADRVARSYEMLADYESAGTVWTPALYKGRQTVFQDSGGKASQDAIKLANEIVFKLDDLDPTALQTPIGSIIFPFRKTPIRIAAAALRRTPLQTMTMVPKALSGQYKGDHAALVADVADSLIAWGLALAAWELLDLEDEDGLPFITGTASSSSKERSLDYATAPPLSIRLWGEWRDYSEVEPFSTSMGLLVDAVRAAKDEGGEEAMQALFAASFAMAKDKTFLRTFGDLMELAEKRNLDDRSRIAEFVRFTLVQPMVPNLIRQTARESDDLLRERRSLDDGPVRFWMDGMYATSADPLTVLMGGEPHKPRYNAWGKPIERPYAKRGNTDLLARLVDVTAPWLEIDDISRVDIALRKWKTKVETGQAGEDAKWYYPGRPGAGFTEGGVKYRWTPTEYETYTRESGERAEERILSRALSGGINLEDPTERDIEQIQKIVNAERKTVRDRLKAERRQLAEEPDTVTAGQ